MRFSTVNPKLVLVFAMLFIASSSWQTFAQSSVYFNRITTNDGLSQNDINAIYQDKKGFLWFGTHDGLNLYDGYSFTIYQPNPKDSSSISSNLIYDIVGDSNDNLWIATTGNGLNYFNRVTNTFQNFTFNKNDNTSLSNDYISSVLLDTNNRLWVGTDNGLNMADLNKSTDTLKFKRFYPTQTTNSNLTNTNANAIYTIYEGIDGGIWVGGSQGLFKAQQNKAGSFFLQTMNETIGLPKTTVRAIAQDHFGRFLIGTGKGVYLQSNEADSKVHLFYNGFYNAILVDNENNIWFGSNNGLLCFKSLGKKEDPKLVNRFSYDPLNDNSISKDVITSLYLDKTGIIWVGTNGGGINSYDPGRKHFAHIKQNQEPNSLSYDKIRAMYEDSDGTLWVGTEGGGLNFQTKANDDGRYDNFSKLNEINKTFALTELINGGKKYLYIGAETSPGLYRIDITDSQKIKTQEIETLEKVERSVFSLLTDSSNRLWIGTYGGGVQRWVPTDDPNIFEIDVFTNSSSDHNSIANNIIRNIYEDHNGNIWFGTSNGLSLLTPEESTKKDPKFSTFKNKKNSPDSISHNYIMALYESAKKELWIGTFGGGLNKLIQPGNGEPIRFKSFSEEDGLPNNVIKGILEDDLGRLWISTNNGISRFDPELKSFTNYDKNDGLQDNEFQELATLKRKNGTMFFGGVNGINVFNPKNIIENKEPPETVITDFLIANKSIAIGEEVNERVVLEKTLGDTEKIELKFSENNFSFEFAALHYAAPGKNQFTYKLEGFDKNWILTTPDKRFATYTNLEPNTYTFKVKASNNDNLWDETPVEIKVKVIPPWWRSTIAKIFYTLFFLGLLWLFWRYTFIKTSRKHQLELEHLESEKAEEIHQAKLDFFTNISHELRTPLTLLKGPLDYLKKSGAEIKVQKVAEQYNLMEKNVDYLMRLVDQLLDFRKLSQGKMRLVVRNSDIIAFIEEVAEPFQFLAKKQSINFEVSTKQKELFTWFDHGALEKIINNLLSNAFKFTPANGRISIVISHSESLINQSASHSSPEVRSNNVQIEVSDSGPGISQNQTKQIFERYYIDETKDQKNPKGIGIGLSFTKSLIELHQGSIDVKSEANKGTYFLISLPANKEAYQNNEEISIKEASESDYLVRTSEAESFAIAQNDEIIDENLSKSRSNLPSLLIVDDNEEIRLFIKQVLEETYTIFEAEDGEVGLKMANKHIPNIIISDILMPVMDGIEFSRRLKNDQATSHIPIIMLTAKSAQESELEALKIGVDDYLKKPFDISLLQIKLANIISYRKQLRDRFNKEIILQPNEVTVTSSDEKFLQSAMDIVEKHMTNTDFNVEMMVKEIGHSRSNLYLKFKELTGLSSSEFIRSIRLKRAVNLLEQSDLSVKEIMYMTGFNTASYFSKCFKKQFGVTPSEYVREKEQIS